MKKTFLAGLATLLPIAITFFVILFIVDFLTAPFVGVIEELITHHGEAELAARHSISSFSRVALLFSSFF